MIAPLAAAGAASALGSSGIASSLISGGASLLNNIGNLIMQNKTNKMNYKMFKEANQFAHDEAQLAFDRESGFAEKMFNLENEYNSPLQMLGRLEEAGLSPFDYFSNGNYVGASSQNVNSAAAVPAVSHAMQSPTLDINANGAINAFAQVIGAISESKYKDAQAWDLYNTADARIKKIISEANYNDSLKALSDLDAFIKENKFPYEVQNLMADYENALADRDLKKATELLRQVETSESWERSKTIREMRPYLIANARHLYDVYSSEIAKNYASSSESLAHADVMKQEKEFKEMENTIMWYRKEYEVLDYSAKRKWLQNPENFNKVINSYSKAIDSSNMDFDKRYEQNKRLWDIYHDYNQDRNFFLERWSQNFFNMLNREVPVPLANPSNFNP